jgi:hypothetical protein
MRKSPYASCNCSACRSANPKRKRWFKRLAHRKYRRAERAAIHRGQEPPQQIAAGYKAW